MNVVFPKMAYFEKNKVVIGFLKEFLSITDQKLNKDKHAGDLRSPPWLPYSGSSERIGLVHGWLENLKRHWDHGLETGKRTRSGLQT